MSKEGACNAFGPATLAQDLGLDERELVAKIRAPDRSSAEAQRLGAAAAAFVQELRLAGLTVQEIAQTWQLTADEVEALIATDRWVDLVDVEQAAGSRRVEPAIEDPVDVVASSPSPELLDGADEVWRVCCREAVARSQGLTGDGMRELLLRPGRQPELVRLREMRDAAFVRLRSAGFRLDEIAQDWGVTRERVRQICNKRGGPTSLEIATARLDAAERKRSVDERDALAFLAVHDVDSIRELADALDWSDNRVRAALPGRVRSLLSNAKALRTSGPQRSRDDVVAILQAAAEIQESAHEEGTLTGDHYDRVKDDLDGPSRATIAKMFGSWSEALEAAGLHSRKGKPKRSKYTDERLWDYVVHYVSDPNVSSITYAGYDDWRTAHEPSAPSAQFVRNRLGRSWTQIRTEAFRRAQRMQVDAPPELPREDSSDLSDYEYWAAEETLNRVRAGGANPADPHDYDRYAMEGAPTASSMRAVFGSWGSALGALGWDPTEFVSRRVLVSDEESLEHLRDYARATVEGTGQVPTTSDWEADRDKTKTVGPWSYVRRFGSWRDALAAADVPENLLPPRFNFYSDSLLLGLLHLGIESTDGRLTLEGWDSARPGNWPSGGTYLRRFGSWAEAVRLAHETEMRATDS